MRIIYFTLLLVFTFSWAKADPISDCGIFKIDGYALQDNSNSYILINKGTRSEIKIIINRESEPKLWPYVDKPVQTTLKITKLVNPFQMQAELQKIKLRKPDPLRPNKDSKITFVKSSKCDAAK